MSCFLMFFHRYLIATLFSLKKKNHTVILFIIVFFILCCLVFSLLWLRLSLACFSLSLRPSLAVFGLWLGSFCSYSWVLHWGIACSECFMFSSLPGLYFCIHVFGLLAFTHYLLVIVHFVSQCPIFVYLWSLVNLFCVWLISGLVPTTNVGS